MKESKLVNMGISIVAAFVFWGIMTTTANWLHTSGDSMKGLARFFSVFGGSGSGYVKLIAYAVFLYGVLDLRGKNRAITKENEGFSLNILPTQDQLVLSPDEVGSIKLSVIELEKRGFHYRVSNFIKKACTQFRNDESVSDTMQVLETQITTSKESTESELEEIRYIIQAIPMLGFIGTIIELGAALGAAPRQTGNQDAYGTVIDIMSSAFDTTLVALGLTLVLTLIYHAYLEKLDTFYSRTKSYIIDNLVSRIYKG